MSQGIFTDEISNLSQHSLCLSAAVEFVI